MEFLGGFVWSLWKVHFDKGCNPPNIDCLSPDVGAMEKLGKHIAGCLCGGFSVWFFGCLGAGKTTLCSAIIRALSNSVSLVPSPAFSIVKSYPYRDSYIHHFDFFRLKSSIEIEEIGFRDYLGGGQICLIEWPQLGYQLLPKPHIVVDIAIVSQGRQVRVYEALET